MKRFRDDMAEDIGVFVELNEFAELTWIDGVLLPAQVIERTADKSNRQNETFAGLHGDFTTVYYPTAPFIKKRERIQRHGEIVYVNGKRYTVESAREEHGITKLVCSAYRQNTLRQNSFGEDDPYGGL